MIQTMKNKSIHIKASIVELLKHAKILYLEINSSLLIKKIDLILVFIRT